MIDGLLRRSNLPRYMRVLDSFNGVSGELRPKNRATNELLHVLAEVTNAVEAIERVILIDKYNFMLRRVFEVCRRHIVN